MTVDEALAQVNGLVEGCSPINAEDVEAYETLRRYIERVREVERDLSRLVYTDPTGNPLLQASERLAAAREGRDDK